MKRTCENCWWVCPDRKACVFPIELKQLEIEANTDSVCWGWRPIEKEEKHAYMEKYGREIDRIGVFPTINLLSL